MLTTLVGQPVSTLDTPALLVDLDAMDRNIAVIAGELSTRGVAWRPHAKGHKSPAIAHRQLAAGAIGVTCAKLGEAEVFATSGVKDILVANQIVGPLKTRRLAALVASSGAAVAVAVDDPGNAEDLNDAAGDRGVRLRVLIEVDVGMERCGVPPGEPTVALAKHVAALPHLRFAGLMAWEGHAMGVADPAARRAEIEAAVGRLTASAAACRDAGLPVEIVSCGGTGTYLTTGTLPGVTEVQAGGGTLGDALYRDLGVPVEPALALLAQVVSRPTPDRAVLDAGRKTIDPSARPPTPRDVEVIDITFSAEHARLRLPAPSDTPRVGDRLLLDVGYHDQAVHLHDHLYAVRDGLVEAVWPVAARGRLQ